MKTTLTVLSGIILILLAVIVLGVLELRKEDQLKQSVIDGLRKANKKEADSLTRNLKATQDSLKYAFETIRIATVEREASHARTQKTIERLQQIIYIKYESDSARLLALKELYPSWK